MIIQAGNAVAAWIYLWMTFQLGFYESTDLLPRVSDCGKVQVWSSLPAVAFLTAAVLLPPLLLPSKASLSG